MASHAFIPSEEGLFCLFCGRTASEHHAPSSLKFGMDEHTSGALDEEDNWDTVQEELQSLTRRLRVEMEARQQADSLLAEMKSAFEKLREDVGEVRTWGSNLDGQRGHAGGTQTLVEVRGMVRQVACGGSHTAALTDNGQLFIWGRGSEGQLGLGDARSRPIPTLLKQLGEDHDTGPAILHVACGALHTIVVLVDGDVYAWGANDEMQTGLGQDAGQMRGKVLRPALVSELLGKGIFRVGAGKNFSVALGQSGDVYTWGAGGAFQLGHGTKANQEYPRKVVEGLHGAIRIGSGACAEHGAAILRPHAGAGMHSEKAEGMTSGDDEIARAEEQLEKTRARREEVIRSLRFDLEALEAQAQAVGALLDSSDQTDFERLSVLRDQINEEVTELEMVLASKQHIAHSMALLDQQKTNQFRADILMRWSRPKQGDEMHEGSAAPLNYSPDAAVTPRTVLKLQGQYKDLREARQELEAQQADCDDQLEQIELEKERLHEAANAPDILDALEDLRAQLTQSKKSRLAEFQRLERAERSIMVQLGGKNSIGQDLPTAVPAYGVSESADVALLQRRTERKQGSDAASGAVLQQASELWNRLHESALETVNTGQHESLGIKDLIRLSNEQIENVMGDVQRTGLRTPAANTEHSGLFLLVHDLLIDNCKCRRRLNDYTEGLVVQVAQKLDTFKSACEASKPTTSGLPLRAEP